jgi:curved DNA-binding protein CbpA
VEDHYTILGVTRTASSQEIDAAWRRAVKFWHPDRNDSAEAKARLQQVNAARSVLMDDVARKRYDRERGYIRPVAASERMKRPVRTAEQAERMQSPEAERRTAPDAGPTAPPAAEESPSRTAEWWERFADAAKRNAEAVKNEALRAAAEQDRADSTTIIDRRPFLTRYVLMPIGIAAILIAVIITLMLV